MLGRFVARLSARRRTVTDVASAKGRIVDRADDASLPFIGGHPMAGRELSGYAAALPDLFVDRPWVTVLGRYARLCDGERVGELIEACGAIQIPMDARAHDSAVAAISHMPLVVSAALVEAVAGGPGEPERRGLARRRGSGGHGLGRHDAPGEGRARHGGRHRRHQRRGDRRSAA